MNATNNESRFHSCLSRWLVLLGLMGLLASPVVSALEFIEFVDLGTDVSPTDINDNRVVVGSVGSYPTDAFRWEGDVLTILGDGTTVANSINGAGQIVGNTASGTFFYDGVVSDLTCPGFAAGGINDYGMIAGGEAGVNPYRASPDPVNPAIYDGSTCHMIDLARVYSRGTRQGVYADQYALFDINSSGYAVGRKIKVGIAGSAAVVVSPLLDVTFLSDTNGGYASAINSGGKIVGTTGTNTSTGEYAQAFLYDGSVNMLGTLAGGLTSSASDINDDDVVVGSSWLVTQLTSLYEPEKYHAFLKQTGQPMADLNDLGIMSGSGWILTVATAINNNGDIVGTGLYNGETHGFLLMADNAAGAASPVPTTPSNPPTIKQLPVAMASVDPGIFNARQPVAFSGEGSHDPDGGEIADYAWDFGDGKTGNGMDVSHTYKRAGAYTATLTVTDDEGQSASDSVQITILKRDGK